MMNNRIKKLTIASLAAISICIPFVVYFEGDEPVGYADPVGIPTAGVGHTGPDVIIGKWYDEATRQGWLKNDLAEAAAIVERCAPSTIDVYQRAAFVSFAYNVGAATHRPTSNGPERKTKPEPARHCCPGRKQAEKSCQDWSNAGRRNTNCA